MKSARNAYVAIVAALLMVVSPSLTMATSSSFEAISRAAGGQIFVQQVGNTVTLDVVDDQGELLVTGRVSEIPTELSFAGSKSTPLDKQYSVELEDAEGHGFSSTVTVNVGKTSTTLIYNTTIDGKDFDMLWDVPRDGTLGAPLLSEENRKVAAGLAKALDDAPLIKSAVVDLQREFFEESFGIPAGTGGLKSVGGAIACVTVATAGLIVTAATCSTAVLCLVGLGIGNASLALCGVSTSV